MVGADTAGARGLHAGFGAAAGWRCGGGAAAVRRRRGGGDKDVTRRERA